MKSAPFGYHAPETVDEAVALLEPGGDVRVLAGGQSLMTLMKLRRLKPRALVDINHVAGLDAIEERDGELVVGALVRQQSLLDDPVAARSWPLIREALQYVGYRATRHRGTVGGSLAYAAAWAELTAVAVALDATIDARSQRGSRSIRAREFFRGPNETALGDDELITAVRFPAPQERSGSAFHEVSARYRDYAQVGAAAVVTLGAGGTVHGRRRSCCCASRTRRIWSTSTRSCAGPSLDDATLAAVDGAGRRARAAGRHRGLRQLPAAGRRRPRAPRAAGRRSARGTEEASERPEGQRDLPVRVEVNGAWREGSVEPRRTLADFLREDLDLTGTHLACEHGFCGNCNVLLDGRDRPLVPHVRRAGRRPLGRDGRGARRERRHAERAAAGVHRHHGLQCGFCTPAMLMTAIEFLRAHPDGGSDEQIRDAISGVTCRCTGYQQIVESIQAASQAVLAGALEGGSR